MKPSSLPDANQRAADDRLAAFADRVIGARQVQPPPRAARVQPGTIDPDGLDEDALAALEDTIVRFNNAVIAARPDPTAADRMQARLMAECNPPAPSRWEQWKQFLRGSANGPFALAAAMLAILLVAGLLIKPNPGELAGAGLATPFWAPPFWAPPLVLAVALLLIVFIVRKDRS